MFIRKLIKTSIVLLGAVIVATLLVAIKHPIFLKYLAGTARHIGKPIVAAIYADGTAASDIDVYRVDETKNGTRRDYYLVRFTDSAKRTNRDIVIIDTGYPFVGTTADRSKTGYDVIFGRLFKGEVGSKFTPFKDDIKGYNFDPELWFTDKTIKIKLPPEASQFACDSLRIEL